MPNLFSVLDKDGNTVELSQERWERHIIDEHQEVAPYLAEIKQVIESPAVITRDAGGIRHLARLGAAGGKWAQLYLEVVVRYQQSNTTVSGQVLTIHFTKTVPRGILEWMQK